jgi:hypothetical protein
MKEHTKAELDPYMRILGPFDGLAYASLIGDGAWRELAIALKEESVSEEHARRIVARFVRQPRYDTKGYLVTDVPSAMEFRVYARTIPGNPDAEGPLPEGCDLCRPYGGLGVLVLRAGMEAIEHCGCARGVRLKTMRAAKAKCAG